MDKIIITAGEPAGIGPDLCVMLAQRPCPRETRLIVIADPYVLESRAHQLHLELKTVLYNTDQDPTGKVEILPIKYPEPVVPGKLDPRNSPALLESIDRAIHGCQNGEFNAMVTNPVNKATIMEANLPFVDHTSYLRKKCKSKQVVMALFGNRKWCVALMTTHIPIKDVSRSLSVEHVSRTLSIIDHDFSLYLGKKPKIGVCGLNPHAGEDGHIGREEIEVISPAILDAQDNGIICLGPLSGDTAFCDEQRQQFDVILASYHDQGLAPFKLANAFTGTNVTFGLPIIRTSVDHGTAIEKAGQGRISSRSLEISVQRAIQFCISKKNYVQG
ncbi:MULTISPECIES: 4-hydroxythreonine-4-phosphate dehydrogenase PdxA [Candidatus Ichthyocystis]|uniref:4-hydroxythreonine-4-phosphate dehydrogenase n=1 Tax=Candidatus Ichthyocystis hellenicum TaxID=1561003 RepID=A0A0S4M1M8_9BURK|nr:MULTISPECIES: 4-hydroxythreonine-4-phosphate dehydrogenase PdxA [Ichthyocystis]CUT17537.1 4-hydroxythreonine-4-phosphate dehydrogenase [Candidatus Ichthyocystis hellenicum]